MTAPEFDFIRKLLYDRSGIALDADKQYLAESRLAPLLRLHTLTTIGELVGKLKTEVHNGLQTKIIEALVTSETSFFRYGNPYEALRKAILPDLIQHRQSERRLTIWSAACSTRQEPYTIAITLREFFPELANWTISILATDISTEVIAKAKAGAYNQFEANRGLPAHLLIKYFKQTGNTWHLNEDIRKAVDFRQMNLADSWPYLPPMDLVFVRNVMIYFDVETKKTILNKVAKLLRPDGYLLLGGAETTYNLSDAYRRVEHFKTGFYQLADANPSAPR